MHGIADPGMQSQWKHRGCSYIHLGVTAQHGLLRSLPAGGTRTNRFLSPGEPETDVIHEWMGRAVPAPLQLHPSLLHLGAGLRWTPSLQDMWHIHVTAWSTVALSHGAPNN